MSKKVAWTISLMVVCVIGIACLQVFYSWQSYKSEQRTFARNANEAFATAVDSALSIRTEQIVGEFKGWISDTSFARITSKINQRYKTTVFTLTQVTPSGTGQDQISMSLEDFRDQVAPITPKARDVFIAHLTSTARNDLRNGYVFYYTQTLGDRLNKARFGVPIDTAVVGDEFRKQLQLRGIKTPFTLRKNGPSTDSFQTIPLNIALKSNGKPRLVSATFQNSDAFVFGKLKWTIATSVMLVLLTIGCFAYTLRLLLTQHKLTVSKDDFINTMTHELHTPIASITVTAQALKKFVHDNSKREEYLGIILHQAQRLGKLTSEILDAARAGVSAKGQIEKVDMGEVVKSVIEDFQSVSIKFRNQTVESAITANASELKRVLANLVDNAVKYNDKDSVEIEIIVSETHRYTIIEIQDNGPGIETSEQTRIFDPFYRITTGDIHNVKGYGLGLHYVKSVVRKYGGDVSVANASTSGAIFTLKFPK